MKYMDVVIKVGSFLTTKHDGQLNRDFLEHLVAQIVELREAGKKVVLVSSGAVAAGRVSERLGGGKFKVDRGHTTVPLAREQVLAAVGQPRLMGFYITELAKYGIDCAQIMVTRASFENPTEHRSLSLAVRNALNLGIVPIFNENDVLSIEELAFRDNDHLACMVAATLVAGRLIILTNVPGVFDPNTHGNADAALLPEVQDVNALLATVSKETNPSGKGGMYSKLLAARFCGSLGVPMHIASGLEDNILTRLVLKEEALGTFFPAVGKRISAVKTRIALAKAQGTIMVSTYVAERLRAKEPTSVILTGIESVDGVFRKGDIVSIVDEEEVALAKGQVRYSSDDLRKAVADYRALVDSEARVAGGEKHAVHADFIIFSS